MQSSEIIIKVDAIRGARIHKALTPGEESGPFDCCTDKIADATSVSVSDVRWRIAA